jgi:hypothetical protein
LRAYGSALIAATIEVLLALDAKTMTVTRRCGAVELPRIMTLPMVRTLHVRAEAPIAGMRTVTLMTPMLAPALPRAAVALVILRRKLALKTRWRVLRVLAMIGVWAARVVAWCRSLDAIAAAVRLIHEYAASGIGLDL